ncbi:PKD domain-containing protein [Limnohabitans sp. WS1]|uniref:PKD domain-containing protein n=1 Tax=Limnohabitans sp. WS1 TaxID=1100726 RepID=UPI0011B21883|nr:PKD domain-containing protein [Limnohabitans sp. WS1]
MKTAFKLTLTAIAVALLVACGGGSNETNTEPSSTNTTPVANAGQIQNILVGATVTLNGSNSSDPNNDALTFSWTLTSKPAGSTAILSSATSAMPTFTADVAGAYVASLFVNDGKVSSTVSTVTVNATVENAAPVANAGVAQNITTGNLVTLNGSNSSDANGDALTYSWSLTSKPVGSTAILSSATSAMPTFTADVAGAYVASVVVNDGKVSSTVSIVTVNATVANAAPVANAGVAQNITAGNLVTLNGSNSSDANNDALTFIWTLTSKPAGSTAILSSATSAMPTFTADVAGAYVASLFVNDGKVSSTVSTVTVNATVENAAPVANAGVAQNITAGNLVTLNGSNSSDANNDALTFIWTLTSKPAGSTAILSSATSAMPTFTADVAGTYVASLVVNDGKVSSTVSTVTVNATVENAAPVANAGVAQNITAGNLVTLNGSNSSDANGDALTYSWSLTSKPAGSTAILSSGTSAMPTFTADVAGAYVASLVVNDGKVSSTVSTVSVNASSPNSITLKQTLESICFFNCVDTLLTLPYTINASNSNNSTCLGSGCSAFFTITSFKLIASGQNYTVTNLQAINLTTSSLITPFFNGLSNGQIITAGQTVLFSLQTPFTQGVTVNLNYSFTIQETGETFNYTVATRTN